MQKLLIANNDLYKSRDLYQASKKCFDIDISKIMYIIE